MVHNNFSEIINNTISKMKEMSQSDQKFVLHQINSSFQESITTWQMSLL